MSEEPVSPQPDDSSKVADAKTEGPGPEAETPEVVAGTAASGQPAPAADSAAAKADTVAKIEGDISMRRSPWKSSMAAIRYVQEAAKTDYVQIRTSDRLTIIALLFFCIAEVLSLVYSPLHGFRFALMCCCDFILGTCVLLFLVYRVGILSALNTRQALICWQMMMGCIFLGIFLCLNAIFAIAYLVETFLPHPML
jgi:hypothetical protein